MQTLGLQTGTLVSLTSTPVGLNNTPVSPNKTSVILFTVTAVAINDGNGNTIYKPVPLIENNPGKCLSYC